MTSIIASNMVSDIKPIEGKFPENAIITQASVTLNDLGDKTISMQVKMENPTPSDFAYDWEVMFKGETYIQPLREPQVNKSNESIYSIVDLTFYHKGIYNLKRYFFVDLASTESGTMMVDKYIAPLSLNFGEFVTLLTNILQYYFGQTYYVTLNPNFQYDVDDKKLIDINYTHIWDVVLRMYELYGVRWDISEEDEDAYYFNIGWEQQTINDHTFEYGYNGGLLKFERQVQSSDIHNQMFGRGGSQNLPYRYFKKQDPNNQSFLADPDWIPELENIYFSELRGKTFRDYVKGWKTNPNRDTLNGTIAIESYDATLGASNEAYAKGHSDAKFSPIEYVEDKDSIAKYGIIQGGLGNNEEIFPTIQKRVLSEAQGRVDEIVAFEEIVVDEPTSNTEYENKVIDIEISKADFGASSNNTPRTYDFESDLYVVPNNYTGNFIKDFKVTALEGVHVTTQYYNQSDYILQETIAFVTHNLNYKVTNLIIEDSSGNEIPKFIEIPSGTSFRLKFRVEVSNFIVQKTEKNPEPLRPILGTYKRTIPADVCAITIGCSWELDYTSFNGQILGNYIEGITRISGDVIVAGKTSSSVYENTLTLYTEEFTISKSGATSVDVPIRIKTADTTGSYSYRTVIDAIDQDTGEVMQPTNIPEGRYKMRVVTTIKNLQTKSETYTVELLPAYIYYPYDADEWKPTFNIWIKNIWDTAKIFTPVSGGASKQESDNAYKNRIWNPILGDRLGNEAKVVFSSGMLSGYSDYEFPIKEVAYDDSKSWNGVSSHWRLTLGKSNADIEATGKWLPSIQTQGKAGDFFYFIGIDMPHDYVLWAEEEVDNWKRKEMQSQVKPTFVVQFDKVRLNQLQEGESRLLLDKLIVGRKLNIADCRFIAKDYETLSIQSITYSWNENTTMLPDIEVTLSDNILPSTNVIDDVEAQVLALRKDVAQQFSSTTNDVRSLKRIAKTSNTRVSETNEIAIEARTQAQKASETATTGIESNKEALFVVQKQVNTLIGSDTGKSVRDIAREYIPTEIATAMPTQLLNQNTTEILPNIFYEAKQYFQSFTLPTLIDGDEGYNNKWIMRFTLASSNLLSYPYTISWANRLSPQFDTTSLVEIVLTKNSANRIYGEWKIFDF